MNRRNIFASTLAFATAALAIRSAAPQTAKAAAPDAAAKAVYHLADLEKVLFVLGNIRNHVTGMGGPDKVAITLVVHGPALKSFRADTQNPEIKGQVAEMKSEGMTLFACRNTMNAMKLTLEDLLPGFEAAEKGGVVKLAELQGQGFAYLRP